MQEADDGLSGESRVRAEVAGRDPRAVPGRQDLGEDESETERGRQRRRRRLRVREARRSNAAFAVARKRLCDDGSTWSSAPTDSSQGATSIGVAR